MSIQMNSLCVSCLLNKHIDIARSLGTEEQAMAFTQRIMEIFLEATPENSSSYVGKRINDLYMEHYGLPKDRYRQEKEESNRFVLERLHTVRSRIQASEDPVLTALQYAILGNYIDFSALGKSVSFEALEQMLSHPEDFTVDAPTYLQFRKDLASAKTLLYLTDNAGELGFDMVMAETLQRQYPHLQITFCVRGFPAHNDATREDYALMGVPFPVMDNGSDIGSTELAYVSRQTLDALESADVILAKGMGNTESLYGSGYRVYYAFLVKCPRFVQFFNKPHMSCMFIKEPPSEGPPRNRCLSTAI